MHESILSKAAWPNPAVVLGLLLKPYSLGHELRLTRLGNPLVSGDLCDPRELSEAVLICHQGWAETVDLPFDPLLRIKMALWLRRAKRTAFHEELAKFIQYRNESSAEFPPSGITKPGRMSEPRIAGCPFLLRLQQFLMLQFRLTEAEAWDYPLGLAKLRWGCYWEETGDWSIYNEAEAQFDAAAAKAEQEAVA